MKLALAATSCLAVVGIVACVRDEPSAPITVTRPSFELFIEPPGEGGRLCWGYVEGPAFGGNWWDPRGNNCRTELDTEPFPYLQEDAATGPHELSAVFSEPVSNLVITPLSIWECGSDPGSVTVYTAAGESVTLAIPRADETDCNTKVEIIPGEECGPWYIQRGAGTQALVVGVPEVTRVVIRPQSPLIWHYTTHEPDGFCGFIAIDHEVMSSTQYILSFREFPQTIAQLILTCDPTSVVRGGTVTCTAATEPAGASLRVREWRFDPDAATGLPAVTRVEDVAVWAGGLVVGGGVTVSALVAGEPRTASRAVLVQSRNWGDKTVDPEVQDVSPGNLPDPPKKDEDLGNAAPLLGLRLPQEFITEGPNAGFWYFTDLPVTLKFEIAINTNALREGSIFWSYHPVEARDLIVGMPVCTRRQLLTVVLPLVKKHEGFSRDDADSHVQSYTVEVERQARATFEPVVRTTTDTRAFDAEFATIDAAAQKYTRQVTHSDARNPMRLPCRLDFSGSGQRH